MKRRTRSTIAAIAAFTAVALAGGRALAHDEYFYEGPYVWPIAYGYTYYADAEKTVELGYVEDSCVTSGTTVYANHPYIPTAYYDERPLYVCDAMGPFFPVTWPYY